MTFVVERRYLRPGAIDRVFNALVTGFTRLGLGLYGSRILEVNGRKSGIPRTVPVNVLDLDGMRYLVAPRGDTEWVRNLRAAGTGRLLLGRQSESFVAVELADADKPPVLRRYLSRWWFEVSRFFELTGPEASDEELARVAPQHPVFQLAAPRAAQETSS